MVTFIAAFLVIGIVGFAALYVIREKRRGVKCVGCPDAAVCPHAKNGCCACSLNDNREYNPSNM